MNGSLGLSNLSALLIPAMAAFGQPGHVWLNLGWSEVVAGTTNPVAFPNGIVEPGEAARLDISISFTPVGTPIGYQTGTAPVAGFYRSGFGINTSSMPNGTWSDLGTSMGFSGFLGFQLPTGNLAFCSVQQPLPPLGSSPIATNPLPSVWRANWTPANYNPRQVTFQPNQVVDDYPTLFVFTGTDPGGNPLYGRVTALGDFGQAVQIPVVPGPSDLEIFVLGLAMLARQTRRDRVLGADAVGRLSRARADSI